MNIKKDIGNPGVGLGQLGGLHLLMTSPPYINVPVQWSLVCLLLKQKDYKMSKSPKY